MLVIKISKLRKIDQDDGEIGTASDGVTGKGPDGQILKG